MKAKDAELIQLLNNTKAVTNEYYAGVVELGKNAPNRSDFVKMFENDEYYKICQPIFDEEANLIKKNAETNKKFDKAFDKYKKATKASVQIKKLDELIGYVKTMQNHAQTCMDNLKKTEAIVYPKDASKPNETSEIKDDAKPNIASETKAPTQLESHLQSQSKSKSK